jgi:succinyl-diaminopimelate desuccinylase
MVDLTAAAAIEHDTLDLARRLIACRSMTPHDGGCLDLIAARLLRSGFACERIDRGGVSNLWARRGHARPLACLAGHVDVVPPGPLDQWTSDPFTPTERDGYLYGRGAADMKGPLAAMVTAAERVAAAGPSAGGSLALLITSDEEGEAKDGTLAVVDTLGARGESIDFCIIGEPTSSEQFGDTLKVGRRGSLNGVLRVRGVQCHIAYPQRGRNPIQQALPALAELAAVQWDHGNDDFEPTSFQISNIHAGTGATNVIPGALELLFNFRFSPESTAEGLQTRVREVLDRHALQYDLVWALSGQPFRTVRGRLVEALRTAVLGVTGVTPALSTSGGISDGRFIAAVAREVAEFGPLNESIHKIDERVSVADLGRVSTVYEHALEALLRA